MARVRSVLEALNSSLLSLRSLHQFRLSVWRREKPSWSRVEQGQCLNWMLSVGRSAFAPLWRDA